MKWNNTPPDKCPRCIYHEKARATGYDFYCRTFASGVDIKRNFSQEGYKNGCSRFKEKS